MLKKLLNKISFQIIIAFQEPNYMETGYELCIGYKGNGWEQSNFITIDKIRYKWKNGYSEVVYAKLLLKLF